MRVKDSVKPVPFNGIQAMLFRVLYNLKIMNLEQLGKLAELLGNTAHLNDIIINMDNSLIGAVTKGEIMLDLYEVQERQLIQRYLPNDAPVIELGASIGVVACIVNRGLTSPSRHIVVEANPDLIPTLKKNRDMNHCQFDITEAAIGYSNAWITFFTNEGSVTGSIYRGGGRAVKVPTKTLQSIAESAGFSYFNLISDIEGSEIDIINNEIAFIREHVGWILMETHDPIPYGEEGRMLSIEKLQRSGFEILDKIEHNYCFKNIKF